LSQRKARPLPGPLDARERGFEVVVLGGAVAAVNVAPGDGERALAAMRSAGATMA